jgi:hypothetical protein
MNSQDFLACLRKTDESPEINRLLSGLHVNKKPKVPRGDIEARIDLPKQGLSVIFKPVDPKSSKLAFVAVQFFSDAEQGYKSFDGTLPEKLSFSDNAADVRKKLGKPTESKKEFRLERWKSKDHVLTVEYSKDDRIALISYHAAEYY